MIQKVCNIILSAVLILCAVAAVALLTPQIFGYKTYAVISGSMEPALHVGSLLVVKKTVPEKIITGDIITFKMAGNNSIKATHRVISIDYAKEAFITKGDANNNYDGPVKFERLVGRMVLCIPYLGFFAVYIKTGKVILFTVSFLAIIMLIIFITEIQKSEKLQKTDNDIDNKKGDVESVKNNEK